MPTIAPSSTRINTHRLVVAALLFVSGVLAAISTALSWWTLTGTGSSDVTINFLPGSSIRVSAGGMSQSVTFAQLELGPVGGLYEAILAIAIVVGCLAIIGGLLTLLSSLGRVGNPARYATFRNLIVIVLVISLFLVIVVPALQGALTRQSSFGTTLCTLDSSSTNPCNDFWGSSSGGGDTYTWGADAGWYLAVVATVLLAVGLFLWRSARAAPWGAAAGAMVGTVYSPYPGALAPTQETPVDKLLRAKSLANAGQISPAEFEELKARLMAEVGAGGPPSSAAPGARTEDELGKLKMLHDSGAISEAEYGELRKKVLLRF
ncbi:MAG TPA: SHOCT domain-containing protein [Thermoplasmata archaeon]|nr:SHOCT domain-containing protein [Thermoplasmata archaeon]